MLRAVALDPKPDHLLDHLGVLAAILDIPLIVTEQKTYDLAASLYPQVKTTLINGALRQLRHSPCEQQAVGD